MRAHPLGATPTPGFRPDEYKTARDASGHDQANGGVTGQTVKPRARALGNDTTPVTMPLLSEEHGNPSAGASGETSTSTQKAPVGSVQPETRAARIGQRQVFERARVGDVEREHLAAGVGARLRTARLASGLSMRSLATAAGCTATTVSRIEAGTRRPRASMLSSLAAVLDPTAEAGLLEELVSATGESMAAETTAGTRRRQRRIRAANARRRRELHRAQQAQVMADAVIRQALRAATARLDHRRTLGSARAAAVDVDAAFARAAELRAEAAAILARVHGLAPTIPSNVRTAKARDARQAALH